MADEKQKPNEEKLTPEEKLFQAIVREQKETDDFFEEEKERSVETGTEKEEIDGGVLEWWREVSKGFKGSFLSRLGGLKDFFPDLEKPRDEKTEKKKVRPGWLLKFANVIGIRAINKVMAALVIALVIYLAADMMFGVFTPVSSMMESGAVGASQELALFPKFPEGGIRPLSYYLSSLDDKNAFFPPKPVVPQPSADGGPAPEEVVVPPKNYKLVGISWDAEEYVAMLQVEGENHAAFVRAGDKLGDGTQIIEVTEFSVKLNLGGQQWELQ